MPDGKTDFGDINHDYEDNKTRKINSIPFLIENNEITNCWMSSDVREEIKLGRISEKEQDKAVLNKWFINKIQYLEGKRVSLLVENTTINDQKNDQIGFWRFRLDPRNPLFDHYSYGAYSLIFECTRKKGRLKIIKAFLDTVSRRPYETEGIIEGNFQIISDSNNNNDGSFLSKEDFDWLLKLPERQKDLKIRLEEWEEYLSEHKNAVKNKIGWVAYSSLKRISPTQAEIKISTEKFSDNAKKTFFSEEDVQVLDIEIPKDNKWRPNEDVKEPFRIGSISKDSKLNSLFELERINNLKKKQKEEWVPIRIDLIDYLVFTEPDEKVDFKNGKNTIKDPLERLPSKGLLVNSVFYDELPLSLQQKAISRLKDKKATNPRLEDFIFNISEAKVPIREDDIEENSLVEKKLNLNQINALRKGLNAPDICLIQGPPGTGKTTVIAELCNQVALRNGSVLIASQSNLAVDNALCRIANLKHIRPIRLGARTTEEGNDFLADNVVQRWFKGVKDKLFENVEKQKKIIVNLEEFEDAISSMEQKYKQYHLNDGQYNRLQEEKKRLNLDVEVTTTELDNYKKQLAQFERNLDTLEKIIARNGLIEPSDILFIFQHYPKISDILQYRIAKLSLQNNQISKISIENLELVDLYSNLYQINNCRKQLLNQFKTLLEILSQQNLESKQKESELVHKRESILSEMQHVTLDEKMQNLSVKLISVNKEINELSNKGTRQLAIEWKDQITGFASMLDCYKSFASHFNILKDDEINLISEIKSSLVPDTRYENVIQRLLEFTQGLYDDLFGADDTILSLILKEKEELLNSKNTIYLKSQELQKSLIERNDFYQKIKLRVNETIKSRDDNQKEIKQLATKIKYLQSKYDLNNSENDNEEKLDIDKIFDSFSKYIQESKADLNKLQERFASVLEKQRWDKLQTELIKKIDSSSNADYEAIKDTYISFANVVGATCTETGKYRFWKGREFDLVIVDEVSKATPPELLMPMLLGKQIVLVGDHHQLPPIFRLRGDELPLSETDDEDSISQRLKKYEKLVTSSYFEEMFINAEDSLKSRLTEQYRMHPTIMNLINQFYPPDYQLTCGIIDPDSARQHPFVLVGDNQDLTSKNAHAIWVDTSQKNVDNKLVDNFEYKETGKFNSRFNQYEVEVIKKILCSINKQCKDIENKYQDVAIISFYAGQVRKLRQMIESLRQKGMINNLNLRVGTVDQFQGMERPIVITSLVSSPEKKYGKRSPTSFVKEFRRINVAFSRAQSMLIVVGAADVFNTVPVIVNFGNKKDTKWPYKFLIEAAKNHVIGNNYVWGYALDDVHE